MKDPDQNVQMHRLLWAFTGHIFHTGRFLAFCGVYFVDYYSLVIKCYKVNCIALDEEYPENNFSYFSKKTYVVGTL